MTMEVVEQIKVFDVKVDADKGTVISSALKTKRIAMTITTNKTDYTPVRSGHPRVEIRPRGYCPETAITHYFSNRMPQNTQARCC